MQRVCGIRTRVFGANLLAGRPANMQPRAASYVLKQRIKFITVGRPFHAKSLLL